MTSEPNLSNYHKEFMNLKGTSIFIFFIYLFNSSLYYWASKSYGNLMIITFS